MLVWQHAGMADVLIAEPGELLPTQSRAAESLVRDAFGTSFRTHDWIHGIDGVHVLVTDDGALIAHASVVPRILWHNDSQFSTGYVEGVAVRADQQGRGLGRVIMDHAESIIRERHDIGALNAVDTAAAFYAARDWRKWTGPTAALSPTGLIDTYNEEDCIFVFHPQLPTDTWQSTSPLICDWRPADLW